MCIYLCIVHGLFPENSVVCLRKPPPSPFLFSWLLSIFAWVFSWVILLFLCVRHVVVACFVTLPPFQMHSSKMSLATLEEFLNHATCQKIEMVLPLIIFWPFMGHGVKLHELITPWMIHVSMKSVIYSFKSRLTSFKNLIKDQSLNQPCYGGFEWCPYSTSGWTTRLLLKRPLLFVI